MTTAATAADPDALPTGRRLRRQIGMQSAMLLSGFALAQLCSFARNAIIGYGLSRGDFGIAATITIALQMLETLSDLGAERLLVQATDGDDPRLMAAAHASLVARGLFTGGLLYLAAGAVVDFFSVPAAASAFQLAALVPVLKGLIHLNSRRQQRTLQNRNYLLVEVVPQVLALIATVPMLRWTDSYLAVVWLSILQAALSVLSSHWLAARPYRLGFAPALLKRLVEFGWPIWLSAFPLVVVYQGDRIIVGRLLGMDALAGYSAAFMVAMVPGLLAAKVAHALVLPLLSSVRTDAAAFMQRYMITFEGACVAAAAYLVAFVATGGEVLVFAFGSNYAGLSTVIGWLAAMWALRMVQAVPGMALMAQGDNRPLLTAGLIRATALALAWAAAAFGHGLAGVAAAGVAGELAAIAYVLVRTARDAAGIARATMLRALYPMLAGIAAAGCVEALPMNGSPWLSLPVALGLVASAALAGFALMPGIRCFIDDHLHHGGAPAPAADAPPATMESQYAAARS